MNKKSLAILLRARMRPTNSNKLALSPLPNEVNLMQSSGSRAAQHGLENENKPQKSFLVSGEEAQLAGAEEVGGYPAVFYRIERNLRHALKPMYESLFERLNMHPGGLKFLSSLRADILYILATWLSPAALELHQIMTQLLCWRKLWLMRHASIPCLGCASNQQPYRFKEKAGGWSPVFWVFTSSNTCLQPGLAGINLVKFLIKRVITLVKRDMPQISTYATLSPVPGYIQWLISKWASQSKLAEVEDISQSSDGGSNSTFLESVAGRNGTEVMLNLLTSRNHEWSNSDKLLSVLKAPLLRLCARYLLQEKKRVKALDSVANFHLQNGAMIERINWMADRSEKGLNQSAGIMVNYVYRLGHIEEYAQSYFSTGNIHASDDVRRYVELLKEREAKTD
ncbi:hypothetical protein Pint_09810 [Pistacia integerrima]|uniref:Uncharacterized protein n=1 Tax=Pistacia integerrima TaxID=434235 RepID=A0ACC0XN46_9ROSI|nr:hypothetical protein Pint_09810 [Pistacia integerrima]